MEPESRRERVEQLRAKLLSPECCGSGKGKIVQEVISELMSLHPRSEPDDEQKAALDEKALKQFLRTRSVSKENR